MVDETGGVTAVLVEVKLVGSLVVAVLVCCGDVVVSSVHEWVDVVGCG